MILRACAAAALCCSAGAHAAQSPTVDQARLAAAERMLDAMHFEQQTDRTVEAITVEVEKQVETGLAAKLDQPAPELIAKLKKIAASHMRETFSAQRANLRRGTALIYAKHFTTAELQHLAALQSDPVLAKVQAEIPQIAVETMSLSQALVQSGEASLQARIKAAVEEYLSSKGQTPRT